MDRKEAIERIQEVMTIIKTQHMCKDIDGECTEEDRKAYIQRFEALRMAIAALKEPERKKGKWISELKDDGDSLLRCSICNYPVSYFWGRTNFCPNCGTDMRGEKKYQLK